MYCVVTSHELGVALGGRKGVRDALLLAGDVFGKLRAAAGAMLPRAQVPAPPAPPTSTTGARTQIHCREHKVGCSQA